MSILTVGGLTKYYGAERIFSDISFQVSRGDKVALVGVNGAGKSTLMKIVAGVEDLTSGHSHLARGNTMAYLAQEAKFTGERTLMEEMHVALEHLLAMQTEISDLEHAMADTNAPDWEQRMERYGELTHRFEHAGGYDIEHRIDRTLHGLGFVDAQYDQRVAQFSGGQKTRAALAAALLSDPDLLLLDEPTNHLDLAALEWLERFLKDWDGTLLVISHDRYFLDKVTNRTLEVANGKLDGDYPAGYNKYLQLKAERLELQLKQYQSQQDYIAKTEEFIRRFKNSTLSTQARGRERRLERLKEGWQGASGGEQLLDRPMDQRKVAFKLGTQIRSGDMVLKLEKLVVGYREQGMGDGSGELGASPHLPSPISHLLIKCPELEIFRGQRVALMGPNGSGKTTLLRTIVGDLPALSGIVRPGHKVVVNYYAQAHEGLQMQATVLEEIRRIKPLIKETEARTLLGRFLFSGDDVFKRVGDLSGGERSRVALAQLTLMAGNLLVLDEPTNHLDIGAREALEDVLNEYNGSILFVSHDRYFIDAVADTIWMVQNGGVEAFAGTYSEYTAYREAQERKALADERRGDTGKAESGKSKAESGNQKAESGKPKADSGNQKAETLKGHPKQKAGNERLPEKPIAGNGQRPVSVPTHNGAHNGSAATNGNGKPLAATNGNGRPQALSSEIVSKEQTKEQRKRQRKLAALEEEIAMLEAELKQLTAEMTAASVQGDGKRVSTLNMQYADVQNMLNTRYDEWTGVAG